MKRQMLYSTRSDLHVPSGLHLSSFCHFYPYVASNKKKKIFGLVSYMLVCSYPEMNLLEPEVLTNYVFNTRGPILPVFVTLLLLLLFLL